MEERGYRELFVESLDCGPCPWCRSTLREWDVDGVRCEGCGAKSLPRDVRRTLERR